MDFPLEWAELPELFPKFERPGEWLPLLQRHHELLLAEAPRTRVTAVSPEDGVQRHYAESLEILRIALEAAARTPAVAGDVGSGGGFPGLVAACVFRETRFALIEPLQKRARLLARAAEAMELGNVEVHPVRAESAGRGAFRDACDLVMARAVASLSELVEYTAPLTKPGGLLVLPKGSKGDAELAAAGHALDELRCGENRWVSMRPEVSVSLRVFLAEKAGVTPTAYPRREGLPGKRPL